MSLNIRTTDGRPAKEIAVLRRRGDHPKMFLVGELLFLASFLVIVHRHYMHVAKTAMSF